MSEIWDGYDAIVSQGTSDKRKVEKGADFLKFKLPQNKSDESMISFLVTDVIEPALEQLSKFSEKTGKKIDLSLSLNKTLHYIPLTHPSNMMTKESILKDIENNHFFTYSREKRESALKILNGERDVVYDDNKLVGWFCLENLVTDSN